jgi:hypothetical protein
VLLVTAGYLLVQVHQVTEVRADGAPLVVADASKLDLRNLRQGQIIQWELPVRNRTDRTVQIRQIRTSCGCARVLTDRIAVLPGEIGIIAMVIRAEEANAKNEIRERTIIVTASDEIAGNGQTANLLFTARIRLHIAQ